MWRDRKLWLTRGIENVFDCQIYLCSVEECLVEPFSLPLASSTFRQCDGREHVRLQRNRIRDAWRRRRGRAVSTSYSTGGTGRGVLLGEIVSQLVDRFEV